MPKTKKAKPVGGRPVSSNPLLPTAITGLRLSANVIEAIKLVQQDAADRGVTIGANPPSFADTVRHLLAQRLRERGDAYRMVAYPAFPGEDIDL